MLDLIGGMVRNVAALILLAVFLEMLLPSSSLQRYVKVILGLFLIVAVLGPLVSLIDRDLALEVSAWQFPDRSGELHSILENGEKLSQESERIVYQEYCARLEHQVEALVKLNPGIGEVDAKVEVGGLDGGTGARIEKVLLLVKPDLTGSETGGARDLGPEIEPVQIKLEPVTNSGAETPIAGAAAGSSPGPDDSRSLEDSRLIGQVRETVAHFYGLPEEKIQVVVNRDPEVLLPGEKDRR